MRIDRVKFSTELLKRDMTQKRLAEISGVSRVTIGYIKGGSSRREQAVNRSTGYVIVDETV